MKPLVTYDWRSGSVPPPHYFELHLVLGAQGAARLECQPDYPMNAPPTWTWSFDVPEDALAALVARLSAASDARAQEGGSGHGTVGGALESISLEEEGGARAVPATPELASAVRAAVPAEVWADLRSRRQQYVERSPNP